MNGSTKDELRQRPGRGDSVSRVHKAPAAALIGLVEGLDASLDGLNPETPVLGIATEAEEARRGELIVVRDRAEAASLRDAIARGAAAILLEHDILPGIELPVVRVPDARRALGVVADRWNGQPSSSLSMLGVAGRASSDARDWLTAILDESETLTVSIDPTVARRGAHRLHGRLRRGRAAGQQRAVVEVDAQTAAGGGFEGVRWDLLLHTGVARPLGETPAEARLEAECELALLLPDHGALVLPVEDTATEPLSQETRGRVITYGFGSRADVRARVLSWTAQRVRLRLQTPVGGAEVELQSGHADVVRAAIGAVAAALALGRELDAVVEALEAIPSRPGRYQRLGVPRPYEVWVDTPRDADGLGASLDSLRPHTEGRLWAVVGCGPALGAHEARSMARALERGADVIVLTGPAEGQPPAMSSVQAVVGSLRAPAHVWFEADRRSAIAHALEDQAKGEAVYILSSGTAEADRELVRDWFLRGLEI